MAPSYPGRVASPMRYSMGISMVMIVFSLAVPSSRGERPWPHIGFASSGVWSLQPVARAARTSATMACHSSIIFSSDAA